MPLVATGRAGPRPGDAAVAVLYGTEYGASREIAEKLCECIKAAGAYWPRLLDMAEHPDGLDLSNEAALLVICSTQGDGVPPSEARDFCDWLASPAAPCLPSTHFSVCALGDTSYAHYCACGKALDARLAELGGERFAARADVNREDGRAVEAWLDAVCAGLSGVPLAPAAAAMAPAPKAKQRRWGKARPYSACVIAVESLCQPQPLRAAEAKDTVRAELDLGDSGLSYAPGDALGIYPSNCPQAVDELLAALGATGDERVPVPAWHYEEPRTLNARPDGNMPLREAFLKCYDLRSPKLELLRLLLDHLPHVARNGARKHAVNGTNGRTAASLANGSLKASEPPIEALRDLENAEESIVSAYLEPRHVLDIVLDFAGSRPPVEKVLGALRPLQPRLYSISSSQLEGATRVAVTVAVVRYTSLGRPRIGVTSTYTAERLKVGDTVPVYVHKNPDFRLPVDPALPIVMIGPGTGLAPFRSFMVERMLGTAVAGAALGQAVLYFGCRRADQDFLYGDLLRGWASEGHLTLFTAFSRQQARKVYVQDRVRESGELVWRLLGAGAHVYVCGDAAGMAPAVEEALLDVIERAQGSRRPAAQEFLQRLAAAGRYQRDVWF
ncbi:hypothetical protein WJX81_004423 [Elliptochloris bilobata]|uniref:Uncharacterized protein n=1 Tax=Elliptochloris bilobata TaxID=381761 RepID=A0AAW1RG82_9CHLO